MAKHAELTTEAQCAFCGEALCWIEHVRRFARTLCHNATDTDDLVQDTYLRAYQSWHTFELGTDCRRWLFTICRNVHRRHMRDAHEMVSLRALAARGGMHASAETSELEPADRTNQYDDLITRLDVASALDCALPLVPEPYRSTLLIVLVEDQTYEAAAARLDVPVGTVRSRLSRGRRLVQDFLTSVASDAGISVGSRRTGAEPISRRHGHEHCSCQGNEEPRSWPREQHRVHTELGQCRVQPNE